LKKDGDMLENMQKNHPDLTIDYDYG